MSQINQLPYSKRLLNRLGSSNLKDRQLKGNMTGNYKTMRRHEKMIIDCFFSRKLRVTSSLHNKFKKKKVSQFHPTLQL